jgi:Gluconate 2-dehydrogenase subunit 3
MDRRAALKIVVLSALSPKLNALQNAAACHMEAGSATVPATEYKLQFFSEDENQLLDQLMEMIIPADSHSPGAQAAKTSLFADLMVATSDDGVKKQWRDGLRLIQAEATGSSLAGTLEKASGNEGNPTTDLERFFPLLKQMTINGYYTSSIGIHQDLEYQGNTYLAAFPGCTHPEHHAPENPEA